MQKNCMIIVMIKTRQAHLDRILREHRGAYSKSKEACTYFKRSNNLRHRTGSRKRDLLEWESSLAAASAIILGETKLPKEPQVVEFSLGGDRMTLSHLEFFLQWDISDWL